MQRVAKTCFCLALLALLATPAPAQVSSGIIAGTIKDEQGGVLPGVSVTLVGSDRSATFTTESDGRFRFLNLPPGSYSVSAELSGFSKVVREQLVVSVGSNLDLTFAMKVARVQETITVRGESPIVDSKAMGTSTNFTQAELDKIPTSRDPWALLRTVPGVMVDRVNIAGNETGQQSNFQSKGTRPGDAVWTLDGVVVTDMASLGMSPAYFNYDNFEEIQISTAGQDIKSPTGGVGMNFVVKRGTNAYRGGVRGFFTNDSLESSNVPDELSALGVTPNTADHNEQISDYGFELGGPIFRERAWFYGSWSNQDIRLIRSSGNLADKTILKNLNAKGNWQATSKDMVSVLWYLHAKEKTGRSPGDGGITRDAATATWFQGGSYVDGRPHGLTKIEDNHVFNSNFFVSGKYAYYNTGFGLEPLGGLDMQAGMSQVLNQSFGSTRQSLNIRPQHIVNADANYFRNTLGASHDFKFGLGWRRTQAFIGTLWPGNMILALENNTSSEGGRIARITREGAGTNRTQYVDLYVGDTISRGRMTLDLGVRYDRQWGRALPSDTRSNAAFANLLPGIRFSGYKAPFTWNNLSPRAGATYALEESRRTILRASYSRYAGQLDTGTVGYSNPSQNPGFVDYWWNDLNSDHFAQADEVDLSHFVTQGGGFNPAAPTAVTSANVIDPNLEAPVTQAAVIGIDRELMRDLGVQVNYSFTRTHNYSGAATFNPWIGLSASDFATGPVLTGTLPNGQSFSVQTWIPDSAKIAANGNGRILTNYDGYSSRYHGLEVSLIKRMSDRWMARVGAAWNNATEHYSTNPPLDSLGNPTPLDTEPLDNGGPFTIRSSASGVGDMFIHGKWQLSANALYVLPSNIELGASLFGRQGYPYPVYRDVTLGRDSSRRVLVSPDLDSIRYDDLWNLDLRVARSFMIGRTSTQFIADLFNVMNANTVLVRNRNIDSPSFGRIAQNLSPRILRFGLRVGF
jgi:Carboxypeptidase regulatory-like domain/TonB-dependent Receptor Plug Domain